MKRLASIAMFAGLLSLGVPLCGQDQPPPGGQGAPSAQSAPGDQPQTEPAPATPQTQPAAESETPTPAPPATSPSQPSKPAKGKKPGTRASAPGRKVVVRNGGAKDQSTQLAPGMSKEQELHNRETTTQLLATTDTNLKSVAGRQLTPAQQGVLDQIRTYIRQSKEASDSGDLTRAHTLAYKAHLLSDELMRK